MSRWSKGLRDIPFTMYTCIPLATRLTHVSTMAVSGQRDNAAIVSPQADILSVKRNETGDGGVPSFANPAYARCNICHLHSLPLSTHSAGPASRPTKLLRTGVKVALTGHPATARGPAFRGGDPGGKRRSRPPAQPHDGPLPTLPTGPA